MIRHLYKSLKRTHLRAISAYVTKEDEIVVGVVLAPKTPEHIVIYTRTNLEYGQVVEMSLDQFIEASLKAPEVYIGIASKIFPAVKP